VFMISIIYIKIKFIFGEEYTNSLMEDVLFYLYTRIEEIFDSIYYKHSVCKNGNKCN